MGSCDICGRPADGTVAGAGTTIRHTAMPQGRAAYGEVREGGVPGR